TREREPHRAPARARGARRDAARRAHRSANTQLLSCHFLVFARVNGGPDASFGRPLRKQPKRPRSAPIGAPECFPRLLRKHSQEPLRTRLGSRKTARSASGWNDRTYQPISVEGTFLRKLLVAFAE